MTQLIQQQHQPKNDHRRVSKWLLTRLVYSAVVIIIPMMIHAQSQTSSPRPARDSAFTSRAVQPEDTSHVPWAGIGRIGDTASVVSSMIGKDDLRRVQYQQLADALARTTAWNPLSHGGFGQHDALSILGGRNADLSVSVNGRSVVDPWSGMYQLIQAQPASLDRIEILLGTDAVGRGSSMSLSELNLPTITHNTATPYTALWYHQGGGDLVAVDGTISQNIAQGVNLTLGVRRSGAQGAFPRTGFDIWNVRAGLRWTLGRRTHALLTYQLASLNTDLWGGLTTPSMTPTVLDLATTPLYAALRDETRRHDVSVHVAHMLTDDSSSVIRATGYLTASSLLRLRDSTLFLDAADTLVGLGMSGQTVGLQVRYDQRVGTMQLHAGASVDMQQLDAIRYATSFSEATPQLFAHVRLPVGTWLSVRLGGRVQYAQGRLHTGAGLAAETRLGAVRVGGDLSTTARIASPAEGVSLSPERHVLAMLRATGDDANLRWNVTAFARMIASPILTTAIRTSNETVVQTVSEQGTSRTILGVVGTATLRLGPIEVVPTIRLQSSSGDSLSQGSDVPACMADLAIGYVYEAGFSTVTLGVRSTVVTRHWAPQFVPLTWTYVRPLGEAPLQYDGLNAFLTARVGNAVVRASYENILGQRWYTTANAPEVSRSLRLSVDWSFLD